MAVAYGFAGIEEADPDQVRSLLDARFPEDFDGDVLCYVAKSGADVLREHLTGMFGKSGVRPVVSPLASVAKAKGVLLVLPSGNIMGTARAAREKGVEVRDMRTGRELVLTGEVAPMPEVSPDSCDSLSYDELVELGRQVTSDYQWRLALLSQAVVAGNGALSQYADDIGVNYATLRTIRSVYNAWQHFPGFTAVTFGVAKELMSYDQREKLVAAHPDMTVAQARQYAADAKAIESGSPAEHPVDAAEVHDAEIVDDPEDHDRADSANSTGDDLSAAQDRPSLSLAPDPGDDSDAPSVSDAVVAVAERVIKAAQARKLDVNEAQAVLRQLTAIAEQIEEAPPF